MRRGRNMVNRHEKLGLSEGAKKDGPLRVRRRIIHHVAECFVSRITGRRRGFGKKAKIWRGWGAYEGEGGIGARKKGWEGEEIGGEKMYRGLKSGLGSELVYYNGFRARVERQSQITRLLHTFQSRKTKTSLNDGSIQ